MVKSDSNNADFQDKSFILALSFLLTIGFVNETMIVHIPGEPGHINCTFKDVRTVT